MIGRPGGSARTSLADQLVGGDAQLGEQHPYPARRGEQRRGAARSAPSKTAGDLGAGLRGERHRSCPRNRSRCFSSGICG